MLFKNILVPYDGSKHSIRAYKIAFDMAKRYGSKITMVTCLERTGSRGRWFYDDRIDSQLIKKQTKAAMEQMSKLTSTSKKSGIDVSLNVLETNSVVESLVTLAKARKFDLILLGSHGRTGFNKLVLGSVANGVIQHVRCPVLLVK